MYEFPDYERSMLTLIARIVTETAQEYENVDDILVGGLLLGKRRGELFSREFQIYKDMPFGLSLFCWWPFKPQYLPANREFLLKNRWRVFEGLREIPLREVSQDQILDLPLMRAVPDKILSLELEELFSMAQNVPLWPLLNL
jgi:hypothetical protein